MAEKMKDRANIPTSPACGQWETLLADALDGLLRPEDESTFSSHMATCAYCSEMFEQARRGQEWLEFLAPEPEVPAYLLDRILVETGHGKLDPSKLIVAGGPANALDSTSNVINLVPTWQRPGFAGRMRRFAEPRLLMTAAMAFFSIALTLSMTGVRFSAVKMADLRPASLRSAVEKRIMTASTPIVRYYDHLRFVYEVESRVRELRRSTDNEQQNPAPSQNKSQPEGESHKKDGGSRLNPNSAPQQTVNPPAPLWGSDILQARYELPIRPQQEANRIMPPDYRLIKHPEELEPTLISVASEAHPNNTISAETASIETGVLAMPERSTSCLA
jgi:hypothetical protein